MMGAMQPSPPMIQVTPAELDAQISVIDQQIRLLEEVIQAMTHLRDQCAFPSPEDPGLVPGEIADVVGENTAVALGSLLLAFMRSYEVQLVQFQHQRKVMNRLVEQMKSGLILPDSARRM